jgi:hypothetical protein
LFIYVQIIEPAHGLFGYVSPSGAFLPEPGHAGGRPFEDPAQPTDRPGARAPHVVLPGGASIGEPPFNGYDGSIWGPTMTA